MFKLVLALFCALVVAVFAVQNSTPVVVGFLNWHFEISLALIIVGATATGAVVVFLLGLVQQISHGFRLRELRHKNQRLERELAEARERLAALVPVLEEEDTPPGGGGEAEEERGPDPPAVGI